MPDRPDAHDPSSPEHNPLGLGSRGRESSNTGSTADTSYDAHGSDPYTTDEPRRDPSASRTDASRTDASTPADPASPSSDEP